MSGIGTGGGSDEAGQALTVTASSSDTALVPNPVVTYTSANTTGSLSFTPAANANGVVTVTVVVADDGGTANGGVDSVTNTFTVTVTAVNDAPTLGTIGNVSVLEDAGAQTVNLSGIADGDGASQALTVTASSSDPAIVPNPVVTYTSANTTGSLSFTPAANANGVVTVTVVVADDGGTANGGVDSVTNSFTVAITAVNDAPTLNAIPNATLAEDAGTQTVSLAGISTGAANEAQTLAVTASSSDTGVIPHPSVTYISPDSTGSLAYAPATNAHGTVTITVIVSDNGGTAGGGADGVTNTFAVTVTAVNDAPTLNTFTNLTVDFATGTQTVGLAGIAAGPADEAGQTLTVTALSSSTAIVPHPVVTYTGGDTTGRLDFTPVTNGTVTLTVVVADNGGTAHGGVAAVTNTFSVAVIHVNYTPTLDALADLTINEDAGAQTVHLAGISAGMGETQVLTVSASSSDTSIIPNPAVVYTSASTTGGIRFTPATNANGSVTISVVVRDNGGTAGGAADAVTNTFAVTVSAVNDVPVFVKGANQSVDANVGAQTVANWATGIGAGGGADEVGQTLTFTVTNNNHALFSVQPVISPAGMLTYTVAPDAAGSATVWVQLADDAGGASTAQTFTIAVASVFASASGYPTGAGADSISLADYTSDGYVDVFVGNYNANTVSLLRNRGDGTFFAATNITVGSNPSAISLGDYNGDGRRDLAVANFTDHTVSILMGAGTGPMWRMTNAVPATVAVGQGPVALATADYVGFNGDGLHDIAVVNYLDNSVSILLGTGRGGFTSPIPAAVSVGTQPSAIAVGDFNKDGHFDLAVANSGDSTVSILLGAGNGTFTGAGTVAVGGNPRGISMVELNGDSKQDLVVANKDDDTVTVLLGTGRGGFTSGGTLALAAGASPHGIWTGDMNGDGKNDVLTANEGTDSVSLFLGRGDGTFDAVQTMTLGSRPVALAVRSLAPRSLPAIVAANNGDGAVSVLLNQTPVVASQTVRLNEDTLKSITLAGYGSPAQVYHLLTGPTNGVLLTNGVVIDAGAYPVQLPVGQSNVTYRPGTNYFGADHFGFFVANGSLTSALAGVAITVTPVNDAPVFTLHTNLLGAVDEDSALVTVSGFADGISAGPANENGQTVTFMLKTTNSAFFANSPVISTNGTLTFKPKANSNGVQWVSVYLRDSGGTPYSATQAFAIVVSPVNDRPTISAIASRSAYEDRATNISFTVGDLDTPLNSLMVTATSSDTAVVPDSNLILGGSGATRTLLVTPAANQTGFTDITITVNDGGLATNHVFRLTFLPVNDAPEFSLTGTNIAVAVNSGTNQTAGWATNCRPGPATATDEAAQRLSFIVTNDNGALFRVPPSISTNGTLSFHPASNAVGRATVTVRAHDSGNTLFGGTNQSAAQTFTVEVMAVPFRAGDLLVADRGPAGAGTSVHGTAMGGALFLVNPTNGTQTLLATNIADPTGITLDADGNLIVADYDAVLDDPVNNRGAIYRVNRYNLAMTVVSSGGDFAEPFAVVAEADGNLLVADSDAFALVGAVFRVNSTNGAQTALSTGGYFSQLAGLALSAAGTIYVTDLGDGGAVLPKVIAINPVSGAQTVVSEGGLLQRPAGLAVEPGTGDPIVVDSGALLVLRINAGTGAQTVISTGGYFVEPFGVAIEADGGFIVTEGKDGTSAAERRVYRVDKSTGAQTLLSSGGALEQPRGAVIAR